MDNTKECDRGLIIHGSFWLLPKIHKRILNIASLVTSFQKKGVKLEWTFKCEESFQ
jgi:hypothetical protein